MQNSVLTWALSGLSILTSISPVTCNPLVSTPNCVETRTPSLPLPVTVLHTFEFPSWCENLAIRSNSQILVTRLDTPELLQVDPTSTVDPVTVFAWNASEYMGALGISETSTDIFYVVLSAFVDDSFVKTSGVNSIFEVDMNTFSISDDGEIISNATVTKLVDITDADFLNGMTTLNTENILVADVYNGWVYKVNTLLGNYTIAIDDPLMKFSTAGVNASTNLGVNGIKIKDDRFLYWTNTALGSLNRIQIDEQLGTPVQGSQGTVVVGNVPKADDFVFGSDGVAWVAQNQMDELSFVPVSVGASGDGDVDAAVVVAGSNISTTLAGVSAGHFGRGVNDTKRLYLTTSGALALAINGTVVVAGTVSYVDTEGF